MPKKVKPIPNGPPGLHQPIGGVSQALVPLTKRMQVDSAGHWSSDVQARVHELATQAAPSTRAAAHQPSAHPGSGAPRSKARVPAGAVCATTSALQGFSQSATVGPAAAAHALAAVSHARCVLVTIVVDESACVGRQSSSVWQGSPGFFGTFSRQRSAGQTSRPAYICAMPQPLAHVPTGVLVLSSQEETRETTPAAQA